MRAAARKSAAWPRGTRCLRSPLYGLVGLLYHQPTSLHRLTETQEMNGDMMPAEERLHRAGRILSLLAEVRLSDFAPGPRHIPARAGDFGELNRKNISADSR